MTTATKTVRDSIIEQFGTMIGRGTIPLFELEITNKEGEEDYLLVNLTCGEAGIYFSFDDSYPTWFDGEIRLAGAQYLLPYDEYVDSLDSMLEMIMDNLTEGYLIPNNLLREEA